MRKRKRSRSMWLELAGRVPSGLDIRVVDVAPLPVFAAFGRLNERVLGLMEMGASVTARG